MKRQLAGTWLPFVCLPVISAITQPGPNKHHHVPSEKDFWSHMQWVHGERDERRRAVEAMRPAVGPARIQALPHLP